MKLGLAFLLLGCGNPSRSPVDVVRLLAEAAREGDSERIFRLLGPETRARLTEDAHLATVQAGQRTLKPSDLLAAGWTPPRYESESFRVAQQTGDRAVVLVTGRHGEQDRIELVREGDRWLVELPK